MTIELWFLRFRIKYSPYLLIAETFEQVNLKCDPEKSIGLREQFEGIFPGYHMNKKHWNSEKTALDVSGSTLMELTAHSYELVVSGLTKKLREDLNSL